MKQGKRERLEAAGWRVGTTAKFLQLTAEESPFVEMRLVPADEVRRRRKVGPRRSS